MSIIEKVAQTIGREVCNKWVGADGGSFDPVPVAKAAIEALDIIILPVGAEPEVADIVAFATGGGVDFGLFLEGDNPKDVLGIIQRNGKPVVMESE